jgi:ubiquinone/menaquinone biosynthesis C-methylase UbiE
LDFASLARKYVGSTASGYEFVRSRSFKWRAEERAARELLGEVEKGTRSLDVPVGTGRLLPHIKARGFDAHGLDVSRDMLAIARRQADESGTDIELGIGDIRAIPFEDGHFELVTCLRFLNWIDEKGLEEVVTELARVTSDKLLLGIRYLPPPDELVRRPSPVVRLAMRAMGAPRFFGDRHGLKFHQKQVLESLFERLGLETIKMRLVERRFDGTDYAFFLLRKRRGRFPVRKPEPRKPVVARSGAWGAAASAAAMFAVMAFLNDLFPYHWLNWAVAAAIVAGAAGAIMAFRKESVGRALMWLGSLTVLAFLILYVVLDALIDPFMLADWPVAIVAMLLVLWHQDVLAKAVFADDQWVESGR